MNCHTLYGYRIAIRQITQSKTQMQTELLGDTCTNVYKLSNI